MYVHKSQSTAGHTRSSVALFLEALVVGWTITHCTVCTLCTVSVEICEVLFLPIVCATI